MIRELVEYYESHRDRLPASGMALTQISFLIFLHEDGTVAAVRDCRTDKGGGMMCLTVQSPKRSTNSAPCALYDNAAYVFGYVKAGAKDMNKPGRDHASFVAMVSALLNKAPDNEYLRAVSAFYDRYRFDGMNADGIAAFLDAHGAPKDMLKGGNISFAIEGFSDTDLPACSDPRIHALVSDGADDGADEGVCMITGRKGPIARIHKAVSLPVWDARKKRWGREPNALLVSFQTNSGYDSHGCTQGFNAPVSVYAMNAYTTALNHLLRLGSENMQLFAERPYIFWSTGSTAKENDEADAAMREYFGFAPAKPSEDRPANHLTGLLDKVQRGEAVGGDNHLFHIFGLSNNHNRIIVRFAATMTPEQFASDILRHYEDTRVDKEGAPNEGFGIRTLLCALAKDGDTRTLPAVLCDDLNESVLTSRPYSQMLLSAALHRVASRAAKEDNPVTRPLAGIMKGYLNRLNNHQNIMKELEIERENKGYLCGRLFSVCARMQYFANGTRSLQSNYMQKASSAPAAAFAAVLNLSNMHYCSLVRKRPGIATALQYHKDELAKQIGTFPKMLSQTDMAEFWLGFHYQNRWFYEQAQEARKKGEACDTGEDTDIDNENEN